MLPASTADWPRRTERAPSASRIGAGPPAAWVPEHAVRTTPGPALAMVDRFLRSLLRRSLGGAALRFVLFDGTDLSVYGGTPVATVLLKDRGTLLDLLADPEVRFGEHYSSGSIDVQGNLVAALESTYRALGSGRHRLPAFALSWDHSLRAARDNARHHYDVGNDFYRLWLDARMVYTCAYFPSAGCSLDDAQLAKMDRVCRKLRLRPGERVAEAGCGWGALALHMARRYGVSVKAYNVSGEQLRLARARAALEGLAGKVEFIEDDYRRMVGRFDAFVSVGMLEHVGLENYGTLGEVIDRCLDPEGGRGLLHFIGRDRPCPFNAWIRKRIFPGGYAPSLDQVIRRVLAPVQLSVLDVENLRPHYATTVAHWRARFETAAPEVRARYGEEFTRAWRLYLAGSEAAFRTGSLQLFQVVFARGGGRDAPWGRGAPDHGEASHGEP